MFSEATDVPAHQLLVVLFVATQQMCSASVVRAVFCVQRTTGIVLCFFFRYSSFGDMSELFRPTVNAQLPIVYPQ